MEKKEVALLICVLILAGVSAFGIYWGYTASARLASAENQIGQLSEDLAKTRLDYYALYNACALKEQSFNYTLIISIDDFNLTQIAVPEQNGSGLSIIFGIQLLGRSAYVLDAKLTPTTQVSVKELDQGKPAHSTRLYSVPLVVEDRTIMADTCYFSFQSRGVREIGAANITDDRGMQHSVRNLECTGTLDLAWLDLLNPDGVRFYDASTGSGFELPWNELGG
jgi:hypothetical protein